MTKYADDTSLLVPEMNTVSLEEEFNHLQVWAQTNKLVINMLKTKEIVFHLPNPGGVVMPPPLTNIERVKFAKLLGVYIVDNLGAGKQIDFLLKTRKRQLYLLNQIKKQGLAKQQLLCVFDAIITSRITYAAAWSGFAIIAEQNAMQAFRNKVKRWGIISDDRSIDDILDEIDYGLFKQMQFSNHYLHHILPNESHSVHGM